mmetsp:Transcript_50401/g.114403  ORF Transcript_50401/g.114403 Transcript_50401/m.114403 type:complete len:323 (+) Transcript_50401:208-1176(+)|eukprot:CAMPEP_0172595688 /NCGR_PEP_ID=MMETSP1068-20121228/15305_1 /TAXON_ID=35684 /ORGANISM="Pseudopedinella elastica, Strain CCMP716" /LENGTH=322 /DNA_ID=CAMNT_0013394329 /DNA_START=200 /DNA_END=1168 /DNA_ORIENTATION=+
MRSAQVCAFLPLFLVANWIWWKQNLVSAPSLPQKVIFLGPSCGHVAYSMGFIAGVLDDPMTRQAILEHGVVFGGTSSGAMTAAFASASLHGVGTMRNWYFEEARLGFEAIKNHSTLVMGDEVRRAAFRYYSKCLSALKAAGNNGNGAAGSDIYELPWLRALPISVTEAPIRPHFISEFRTATEFADSIQASCFVPWLMGLRPWLNVLGSRMFDGFLGSYRSTWPDSYLFASFLPTIPSVLISNHLKVYEYDSTLDSFFVKAWPWGDPVWTDAAFEKGLADFTTHQSELRTRLLSFIEAPMSGSRTKSCQIQFPGVSSLLATD